MIDARVHAVKEFSLGRSLAELVRLAYVAMAT